MTSTRWTEEHQALLECAAPSVTPVATADLDRVWNRLSAELDEVDKPRRRVRMALGAVIAVIVLGSSGVAVAEYYSAHTGSGPSDSEDVRLGGPGERLDPKAPDFAQVVAEETADIPFPTASARRIAVTAQVADNRRGTEDVPVRLSIGALRAWVADAAVCSWTNQWAAASASGDDAERVEAADIIQKAHSWPAVTAIDPKPYSRSEQIKVTDPQGRTSTNTFRNDSQFYYLAALTSAVTNGDIKTAAAVLDQENGYCIPELVPNIPAANPMSGSN